MSTKVPNQGPSENAFASSEAKPKKTFKKMPIVSLGIFAVMMVLALLSNPNLQDFQDEMKSELEKEFQDEKNDPTFKWIATEADHFGQLISEHLIGRKNYFICSVFTMDLPYGQFKYLGVFGQFIALQKEDPLHEPSIH
jgi:hypothetical protein